MGYLWVIYGITYNQHRYSYGERLEEWGGNIT